MKRKKFVRNIVDLLKESNIKKSVHVPRHRLYISDDTGTTKAFTVKGADKEIAFTSADVGAIVDAAIKVILDTLAHGDNAFLRNALGDREYEAACLGRVSDETQLVLNHFGFAPPTLISNVYTQVQDLEFDKPPILSAAVTVGRAWKALQERKEMHAIPVANDDGTLFGMMSREDIASYNMELNNACILDKVPLFNVLSVLEGKVINEAGEYLDTVSGEVILAIPESRGPSLFSNSNSVVICGNQPDLVSQALERNVNCLVLCRTELTPELLKMETNTCIISTPYDAYRATRLIFQSTPIGRICRTKDLVCFHLDDKLDDVKELVLKYRESCYPILDDNEKIVGVLTRYHLLRPRRKRVVLVDHNEAWRQCGYWSWKHRDERYPG